MEYSWSQFVAFSQSAARQQKQARQEQFSLMFIAQRGNEDSVKSALKSLEN